IYLDAPNISSATTITLTYPGNVQRIKKSDSGQIKVLFPVPASSSSSSSSSSTTCSTTTPCSTGARLRLNAEDLATAGHVTASVDRKSTRLNSSHSQISYAVFCLKKKKKNTMMDIKAYINIIIK